MRRQFLRFRRPVRGVAVVFGVAAWLSAQARNHGHIDLATRSKR